MQKGNITISNSHEISNTYRHSHRGRWEVYKKEGTDFTTNRGYTGHEHIEGSRLIHMNARLYDPTLGRFLSADPIVQDPYDTQAFNRYSYVRNNPLKYTDPSGHSWASNLFKTLMTVFITVVAYSLFGPGGALVNQVVSAGAAIGLSSSVAIGAAMGGNRRVHHDLGQWR